MKYAVLGLLIILFSSSSFASSAVLRQWLHSNCGGCKEYKSSYAGELMEPRTLEIDKVEDQLRTDPMMQSTPKIRFKAGNETVEANVLSMSAHSAELVLPRTIVSERPLKYGRFTYPDGTSYDSKAHNLCRLAFGPGFRMDEFHGNCRFRNQCRVLSITCAGEPEKLLHKLIRNFDRVLTGAECN